MVKTIDIAGGGRLLSVHEVADRLGVTDAMSRLTCPASGRRGYVYIIGSPASDCVRGQAA